MASSTFLIAASYDLCITAADLSPNQDSAAPVKFGLQTAQANRIIPYTETRFVVASNPYIFVFDRAVKGSKHTQMFQGHQSNVTDLCISGNNLFSSSEDKTWQKWEFGKTRSIKTVHTDCCINSITLIKSKTFLITGNDNSMVEVWDVNTTERLADMKIGSSPIRSLAECPNTGIIICGLQDGNVHFLDYFPEEKKICEIKKIKAHSDVLTRVAASPNGKYFATASADSSAIVWDAETYEKVYELRDQDQKQWIWDVCFTADSSFVVTGGTDKMCRLWDIQEKKLVKSYGWHTKGVTCLTILN